MRKHTLAWIAFIAFILALIGLGSSIQDASADPGYDPQCGMQMRCSYGPPVGPGLVFCPETRGYVNQFSGACPSLWNGPYSPGGLVPNGGDDW